MTMRVASLTRLSSKPKDDEADLPTQRRAIEAYCDARGWVVVNEFSEPNVSAFRTRLDDRDQLQDAIKAAQEKPRRFDVLMIWKLDRLARNLADLPYVIDQFERTGIQVYSVVDGEDKPWSVKTTDGAIRVIMKGFASQHESESTSIRTTSKRRDLAQQSRWMGGPVPFGYRLAEERDGSGNLVFTTGSNRRLVRHLEIDPALSAYVAEMFERYSNGAGFVTIADWLNSLPESIVPRPRGGVWSNQGVKHIVRNPIYKGVLEYNRTKQWQQHSRHPLNGVISTERPDLRIVEPALWEACQTLRTQKVALHPRQRSSTYPFSGTLRCGVCGGLMGAMSWTWTNKSGKHRTTGYRCLLHIQSNACMVKGHRTERVEAAFFDALAALTHPKGMIRFLRDQAEVENAEYHKAVKAKATAEKRLHEIKGAIDKAYKDHYEGKLAEARFERVLAAYEPEERALTELLSKPLPKRSETNFDALAAQVPDFQANWPFLEPDEQKSFVMNLCRGLNVSPYIHPDGHIEFRLAGQAAMGHAQNKTQESAD